MARKGNTVEKVDVYVVKFGKKDEKGGLKPRSLPKGSTVGDALQAAGLTNTKGFDVRLGGRKTTLATRLVNGSKVTLVPQQITAGR